MREVRLTSLASVNAATESICVIATEGDRVCVRGRSGKTLYALGQAYICQVRDLDADRLLFTSPPRELMAEAERDAQEWIGTNLASKEADRG